MEPNHYLPDDPAILKKHFVHHLNRVYYGKRYLRTNLPPLIDRSSFKKLQQGIQEVWEDVVRQIERIEEIYKLIDAEPDKENCVPIIAVFKDAFEPQDYKMDDCMLNDIDTILYLQLLEHVNITSYRMLKVLAERLNNQEVQQLLQECYDESKEDDHLFLMITDEYVSRS
jgi:ferritin-like metal-binding protein YciE